LHFSTFPTPENTQSLRGTMTATCGCSMDIMLMALNVLTVAMVLC
jgi:hypothetical protein